MYPAICTPKFSKMCTQLCKHLLSCHQLSSHHHHPCINKKIFIYTSSNAQSRYKVYGCFLNERGCLAPPLHSLWKPSSPQIKILRLVFFFHFWRKIQIFTPNRHPPWKMTLKLRIELKSNSFHCWFYRWLSCTFILLLLHFNKMPLDILGRKLKDLLISPNS